MGAISFIETMDHTALSSITQEEFEKNVESIINSLPEDVPGNRPFAQSVLMATTPSKPIISRVGTPISTFHVGEESAEPLLGGTSGSQPTSASPFAALQYQLSQLGGPGGPGQQNGLTPQDPRRRRETAITEDWGRGVETVERAGEDIQRGLG
jgi:hypothetical protein